MKFERNHPDAFTKTQRSHLQRIAVGSILLTTACTPDVTSEPSEQPISHEQSERERAVELWHEATLDLQDKVETGAKLEFELALDQCVFWPGMPGFYTVVYNPIIYRFQQGNEVVEFFPFVPSHPDTNSLQIMNGPYRYGLIDEDGEVSVSIDEMGAYDDTIFFTFSYREALRLNQVDDPSLYTPAWATTVDEVPILETHIVEESNLEQAMGNLCGLEFVFEDGATST